ncbi:hypothetical protein [Metallosphaera tengchongensis]|nr:hypothetical protein [Metallosphaera tengchongensis]
MITERLISDAKFYNKVIAVILAKEDVITDKLKGTPLSRRVVTLLVDPEEHPDYLIRLTRGVLPSVSVITPDMKLLGIIESNEPSYILTSLRDLITQYDDKKLTPVKLPPFIPEPVEPTEASIYEVIGKVLDGAPADFRVVELMSTIVRLEKRFSKAMEKLTPMDEVAKFFLGKGELKGEFAIYEAVKSISGRSSKVLEYVEDGKVYRSSKKENYGLLIDESVVGYALLTEYMRKGDDSLLDIATKIKDFVKSNLEAEKGFLDVVPKDPLTQIPYLEPLANAEAGIFFSALWEATGDEEVKRMALKALGVASTRLSYLGVGARVGHALLRLNHGVLTSEPGNYEDVRVMLNKKTGCKYKQGEKCSERLEDFQSSLGLED